ncbi:MULTISPECIES: conjugal transfer protein TraD [Methylobacterium]|uniref:conjugal transfer protein TraD n=1 Tax=Methylobacterium TaxID=407 RepID=UPI0013ECFF88|nr:MULTISPECIES: conjugal transfer protein TraD [unclassified Methylobacterium]NGM38061.1 conjugal transfer protein TraD [Methylobacterium sp. DB0501]
MTKRHEERRADAYRKIQLGGLVIKAGLAELPSNVLLGLLIEGRERMRDPDIVEQFARRGDKEFKT